MAYTKSFVCLANSRKNSGRCIAGIEMIGNEVGEWVRPISSRRTEELSIDERRYENGQDVQLLDLVEVVFKEPRPHACQVENHLIDDEYSWARRGTVAASTLLPAAKASGNAVHFRSSDLTGWLISWLRSPGNVAVIAQSEQY
jgi:hypothetical protein